MEKESLHFEQKLYSGVSATSSWLDGVEEHLFVAAALLPEVTEACLYNQEVSGRKIAILFIYYLNISLTFH